MEPRTVPNVRQKKMIARVLVPPLVIIIVIINLMISWKYRLYIGTVYCCHGALGSR